MIQSVSDRYWIPTFRDATELCIDTMFSQLNVPQEHLHAVWLRIEPLLRWQAQSQQGEQTPTFGVFMTWQRRSIDRGVVDAMLVIDQDTCLALRRACNERQMLLVDNTCLPREATAA